MVQEAYILDAIRTPRGKGKKDGTINEVKPMRLIADLMNSLKNRNSLDTAQVNDIVLGCVSPVADQGANIAKIAAIFAGWDDSVAGQTLNRFCASGLEAVNIAAMKIRSGWEDLVVAGGVESMSRVPMGSDLGPMSQDPEVSLETRFVPQGIGADLIANLEGFSREQLDEFASHSHQKAIAAQAAGKFSKSIIPISDKNGIPILNQDETIRPDCTPNSLGQLKPSFAMLGSLGFDDIALQKYHHLPRIEHVHTAGNSSGIVDGASLLLIASKEKAQELQIPVRAKITSAAITSTEPTIMLTGPAPAAKLALKKANLSLKDIDLFEVNEAFASVVLKFAKDLDVPLEKINVNGGAIAMGHPLGATGGMILGTLLDELEKQDKKFGLCSLCIGGGMGIATIIERVN